MSDSWPPIPDHCVYFGGRPMLPERLVDVKGQPYVRCHRHGLIPADHRCGDSPGDHYCGEVAHPNYDDEDGDQACSHDEWSNTQSEKLSIIASLHQQGEASAGGVSGYCRECEWEWPCPTVHVAHGWGEIHDCAEAGWCQHAGVPVSPVDP